MKSFKKILPMLKGCYRDVIITWCSVFCESILEILIAFYLKDLLAQVETSNLSGIIMWTLILIAMALGAIITGVVAGYFASSASARFGKNMRDTMYVKIQDYSFTNIDKFSPSSIVTRTTTDITNVQNAFFNIIRMVIRAPFMMVFALIMCFITAPQLAWVFLIIIPVILFFLLLIATLTHPLFVKIFNTYDELNESVEEDVSGIRVVKSFNRKDYHVSHFNEVSKFIYRNFIKAESFLAFNGPIMNIAVYSAMIVIAYFGSKLIIDNNNTSLQINELTTLFTYVMMIMMSLMMVSNVYVMIIISRNSLERIVEIVEEKPDIVSPANPILEVKDGRVEFKDVSFAYHKGKCVLNHVNLKFESGESVGIIGPTGSSKTTLISLMARLYDVTSGQVLIGGVDVRDYKLSVLRDAVAVVLQKNVLFSGTIRENLKWGKENATDEEIFRALRVAQAEDFVLQMKDGLDTVLVQEGKNVSGGQRQRLCIARALLKDPKILILDDSTSACDTHTDSLIRANLREERPDVTKFIIAQRVLSIKDCDVILVMDEKGAIVAKGTNAELLQNCSVYCDLYESQQGGGDFDEKE